MQRFTCQFRGGGFVSTGNVQYVGIDLPKYSVWGLRKPKPDLLVANAVHMPFPDDTFDFALMRSVFGQFTSSTAPDKNNARIWGMYEAFRTLKPGGTIVISEEYTPWNNSIVEDYLKSAGFTITDYAQAAGKEGKRELLELRNVFYGKHHTPNRLEYVMTAKKPLLPKYEEVHAQFRRHTEPGHPHETFTTWTELNFPPDDESRLITPIIYKKGKANTDISKIPPALVW